MPPAARFSDAHVCPASGGPILPPCEPTVLIGGLPAARVGDLAMDATSPDAIVRGSSSVMIGGFPAARMGDPTAGGGTVSSGCFTVLIGDGVESGAGLCLELAAKAHAAYIGSAVNNPVPTERTMAMVGSGGGGPLPDQWTPQNAGIINQWIELALKESGGRAPCGNAEKAFEYLRNLRQEPGNYYDTNLAIASDYWRARWDVSQWGPQTEQKFVAVYMWLKKEHIGYKEGPGPVSPYSSLEQQYMEKGIADQTKCVSPHQIAQWNQTDPTVPAITYGDILALKSLVENFGKQEAAKALHAVENILGSIWHGLEGGISWIGGELGKLFSWI